MVPIGTCCRRCGAPRPCAVDACRECRGRELAFERAWAPFAYTGPAREVVLGLKARGLRDGAPYMAGAIARHAPPGLLAGVLVPAPAHAERLRRHGHNQARDIAGELGRLAGLRVCDLLARSPGGRRQVGLQGHARRANSRGWIRVAAAVEGRARVVLVDDVYTTGSTLDACAAALRAAGSGPVSALCFARTVRTVPAVARNRGAA
jgi:predicted amidophosphoribosyltransferase